MEGKAGQRIDGTKLQKTFHATQGSRVLFYEQPRTFWKFEGPEIIQAREEKWQLFGNVNCSYFYDEVRIVGTLEITYCNTHFITEKLKLIYTLIQKIFMDYLLNANGDKEQ